MTDLSSPEAQAAVERVTDAIHAHLGKWATREDANREAEVAVAALLSDVPCPEVGWFGLVGSTDAWLPVDEWPDPVAEAHERVVAVLRESGHGTLVVGRLLRDPKIRADLRILLDAEEGKP